MKIFSYINRPFPDAVEIQYRKGQKPLTFIGARESVNRTLRSILRGILGYTPTGLVQAPRCNNLHPLIFAIALSLEISDFTMDFPNALVVGTADLKGSLTSASPPWGYRDVAKRYRCHVILLPTAIPSHGPTEYRTTTISQAIRTLVTFRLPRAESHHPLSALVGCSLVKRAADIAMAGSFHLLLYGPPGSGKTMTLSLLSAYGETSPEFWIRPQMNATYLSSHHIGTITEGGVILADELPSLSTSSRMFLRELMDQPHHIVAAAMNACPCGATGMEKTPCMCTDEEIVKYWSSIGFSLIDRFDIRLPVRHDPLMHEPLENTPSDWKERIAFCRNEKKRHTTEEWFALARTASRFLDLSAFSTRSLLSFAALARTIADYDGAEIVGRKHFMEAFGYKRLPTHLLCHRAMRETSRIYVSGPTP